MCKIEGCRFPSINKKYDLCDTHNYERLHGRSKQEVYAERSASRPKKVYQFKTYAKPRQQTSKEAAVKEKLSAVKRDIELDAVLNGEYFCQGCGKSYPGLDKSHILSVKHFKHLELVKENINLFCRECHMAWEGWEVDRMAMLHSFEKDLHFIRTHSDEFYNKIVTKIKSYVKIGDPENQAVIKMQKILKIFGETVA
jgi:5-methylcytosine-specific restriction endonuclease McrA